MGYEIKMHIGTLGSSYESSAPGKRELKGLLEMASIDLCKVGNCNIGRLEEACTRKTPPKGNATFLYGPESDDEDKPDAFMLEQDNYGNYHVPVSIAECVKALHKDVAEDADNYRRFQWALALLTSMMQTSEGDEIVVLFRGH